MDRDRINQNPELKTQLDSSLAEFFIEFKASNQDPFRTSSKSSSNKALSPDSLLMDMAEGPASNVAGQITAYATLILGNQYRTHTFLVLILRDFARLLRWDRGGVVVTERFDYDHYPYLFQFLVRYDHAGRDMRGHDETVHNATDEQQTGARATVDELKDVKRLVTVAIKDHYYVIRAPFARREIPVGRWTRTSIAYDVQMKKRVFLKDSWRVALPGIDREGDIYHTLQQAKVPNVPLCLDSGDIGNITYHNTQTHKFMDVTLNPASKQITPHCHHRLVLDTVGRELHCFRCSKEMVRAIHASLIGKYIISYRRITVF
jgi:hypothetical protein